MFRRLITVALLALCAVPAAAAARPATHPAHPVRHPVRYVIVGDVVSATPAASADAPATLVVHVVRGNRFAHKLVGSDVTVLVGARTRLRDRQGHAITFDQIAAGNRVQLVSRAPRVLPADFAGFLAGWLRDRSLPAPAAS